MIYFHPLHNSLGWTPAVVVAGDPRGDVFIDEVIQQEVAHAHKTRPFPVSYITGNIWQNNENSQSGESFILVVAPKDERALIVEWALHKRKQNSSKFNSFHSIMSGIVGNNLYILDLITNCIGD